MEFRDAFKHFQHFFKDKTGLEWDMRLEKRPPNISTINDKKNGQVTPERKFSWKPPVPGRPVGQLPLGYVRPEDREDANESGESSGSGSSRSGSESSESGVKSSEDVVYDTDSDVESNEETSESDAEEAKGHLIPRGMSFAADLALARSLAGQSEFKSNSTTIDLTRD